MDTGAIRIRFKNADRRDPREIPEPFLDFPPRRGHTPAFQLFRLVPPQKFLLGQPALHQGIPVPGDQFKNNRGRNRPHKKQGQNRENRDILKTEGLPLHNESQNSDSKSTA